MKTQKELYDMLDEIDKQTYDLYKENCKGCNGSDCLKDFPYMTVRIGYDNLSKNATLQFVDCPNKLGSLNDKFALKDKFKDFSAHNKSEILDALEALNNGESVFLHGKVALGKTHVCYYTAQKFYYKGKSVFIALIQDIINEVQNMMNQKELNPNRFIKELQNYDLLIIDDLGNEYATDYSSSSILQPIIDWRYKNEKATLISSNYGINELLEIYSDKSRAKKVAPIVSRLQTYRMVEVKNKNWRVK